MARKIDNSQYAPLGSSLSPMEDELNNRQTDYNDDIQMVLNPADARAFKSHYDALRASSKRIHDGYNTETTKEFLKNTASEDSRTKNFDVVETFNIKTRHELVEKINSNKRPGVSINIKRNPDTNFRYLLTLTEAVDDEDTGAEVSDIIDADTTQIEADDTIDIATEEESTSLDDSATRSVVSYLHGQLLDLVNYLSDQLEEGIVPLTDEVNAVLSSVQGDLSLALGKLQTCVEEAAGSEEIQSNIEAGEQDAATIFDNNLEAPEISIPDSSTLVTTEEEAAAEDVSGSVEIEDASGLLDYLTNHTDDDNEADTAVLNFWTWLVNETPEDCTNSLFNFLDKITSEDVVDYADCETIQEKIRKFVSDVFGVEIDDQDTWAAILDSWNSNHEE